jgi:hypothetical protein
LNSLPGMRCPQCGYEPPIGRPKKLDDKKIQTLRKRGLSLREIASELGVTHGAVQAALKRSKK